MSFTEQTDPNAPVTPPPAEAPVIAPKVSGGLAPDVQLPVRKVTVAPQQFTRIPEIDIVGGTISIAAMPPHANVEVSAQVISVNNL
jgi:hypothetical protein